MGIHQSHYDEFFKGPFVITFLSGMEVHPNIIRYTLAPNGAIVYLWDDENVMYNFANIAYMKKVVL